MTRAFAAIFLSALFAAMPALAAGELEINQDCVAVGCFSGDSAGYPVTIANAGTYVLTSDLAPPGSTSKNAIEISVSNVDLDLRGHTINGGGTCTGSPVSGCAGALGYNGIQAGGNLSAVGVRIHDGRIRGFNNGGVLAYSFAEAGTVIERLIVTENNYIGIMAEGVNPTTNIRVTDSVVVRNHGSGISSINGDFRLVVERCMVSENGNRGISGGNGSVFTDNRINANTAVGIACTPIATAVCAVGGNTLYANNGGGSNPQWDIAIARSLGGNVCMDDGTCP